MTLGEARNNIGAGVVYARPETTPEDGTIVRCNDTYVFVLYRGDLHPKATRPDDLTFLYGGETNR